jgi:hypothetical protein
VDYRGRASLSVRIYFTNNLGKFPDFSGKFFRKKSLRNFKVPRKFSDFIAGKIFAKRCNYITSVKVMAGTRINDAELDCCLTDCWETINLNFRFLALGNFFSSLSKRIELSRIAPDFIDVSCGTSHYHLSGVIIRDYLQYVYANPEIQDNFSYWTLIHSVRGITMSVTESMKNKDLRNLIEQDIFKGDKTKFKSFEEVTKFMRNVLSHNYRDQISLIGEDYVRQKNWLLKHLDLHIIEFKYDYSNQNSAIHNPKYTAQVDVVIDWNSLAPGMLYGDVVDTFQNFMMAEFCYNAFGTLYRNRNPGVST